MKLWLIPAVAMLCLFPVHASEMDIEGMEEKVEAIAPEEVPVGELEAMGECNQDSAATIPALDGNTLDLTDDTENPAFLPAAPERVSGCFPVWFVGSCSQTCAPCRCNSDCPRVFGMNQKCLAQCP